MKTYLISAAAILAIVSPIMAAGIEGRGTVAPKHNSNTMNKLGNAIQYPFRKAGENMSVNTHRGTGHNSVTKDQQSGSTEVVRPNGPDVVIAKDNARLGWTSANHSGGYMHRRHRNFTEEGRKYYWFGTHRYYMDPQTGNRVQID